MGGPFLSILLQLYLANRGALGFSGGSLLHQLLPRLSALLFSPSNDVTHARMNASFHYDTSNEHFSSFLSPDMNYSSALWSQDPEESLESAQRRKVRNIIEKARISASHHVLDIGCGWGDLAMEAAKTTGCRVTGLTLSAEQKQLAEKRIREAGLEDQITILLYDYRNAPRPEGGYDRIVSVEMLEHVGNKYMNSYFEAISDLLTNEDGVMVVQGITLINPVSARAPQARLANFSVLVSPVQLRLVLVTPSLTIIRSIVSRRTWVRSWIATSSRGYLPSINQLLASIHTGSRGALEVETVQSIGPHYIRTLQCWRENFLRNWDLIRTSFLAKHQDATDEEIEASGEDGR